jgi:hypothetical protein
MSAIPGYLTSPPFTKLLGCTCTSYTGRWEEEISIPKDSVSGNVISGE